MNIVLITKKSATPKISRFGRINPGLFGIVTLSPYKEFIKKANMRWWLRWVKRSHLIMVKKSTAFELDLILLISWRETSNLKLINHLLHIAISYFMKLASSVLNRAVVIYLLTWNNLDTKICNSKSALKFYI